MKYIILGFFLLFSFSAKTQNTYEYLLNAYLNDSDSSLSIFLDYWYQSAKPITSVELQQLSDIEKEVYFIFYQIYENSLLDTFSILNNIDKKEFFLVERLTLFQCKNFFDDDLLDTKKIKTIDFKPNFSSIDSKPLQNNDLYTDIFERFFHSKHFSNDSMRVLNMLPRRELSKRKNFIGSQLRLNEYPIFNSITFDNDLQHAIIWFSPYEYHYYEIMLKKTNNKWTYYKTVSGLIE